MKKNTLWVYAMLTALLLVLFGIPSALAAGTPTRTENLNLTALTATEDHLADEGWKWEPTQEGGILTLRNFYQKCQHNNSGMISVKGKITLVLEGENVLETTSNLYQPLVTSPNGENADWTIRESEAGGSLTLKCRRESGRRNTILTVFLRIILSLNLAQSIPKWFCALPTPLK